MSTSRVSITEDKFTLDTSIIDPIETRHELSLSAHNVVSCYEPGNTELPGASANTVTETMGKVKHAEYQTEERPVVDPRASLYPMTNNPDAETGLWNHQIDRWLIC